MAPKMGLLGLAKSLGAASKAEYPDCMDRRALAEELEGAEWAEWYFMTPQQRWRESEKLCQNYLALGGSLAGEPDTQSPFFDPEEWPAPTADGRSSLHILRSR